jgi:hypothetical protein
LSEQPLLRLWAARIKTSNLRTAAAGPKPSHSAPRLRVDSKALPEFEMSCPTVLPAPVMLDTVEFVSDMIETV